MGLSELAGRVLISKDTGKGIPPEILAKLGQKGVTYGKAGGNGLGLYHARTMIEGWGGSFTMKSEPGQGTAVLIALPRATGQVGGSTAVLLDDDLLVHMNWKLAAKAAGVELKAYKTPEDFAAGIDALPKDTPIYIDSDLGNGIKGENIIKSCIIMVIQYSYNTGHGRKNSPTSLAESNRQEPPGPDSRS